MMVGIYNTKKWNEMKYIGIKTIKSDQLSLINVFKSEFLVLTLHKNTNNRIKDTTKSKVPIFSSVTDFKFGDITVKKSKIPSIIIRKTNIDCHNMPGLLFITFMISYYLPFEHKLV